MHQNIQYIERWRPDVRLFENLITEIDSFVPPEESLKAEYHRYLSHPAIILRVIPEGAFEKGLRSLPSEIQFPHSMFGVDSGGREVQYTSIPFIQNQIRNCLLYRHLCKIYLNIEKPLKADFKKLSEVKEKGRCDTWKVGDMIEPLPEEAKYQMCYLRINPKNKKDYEKVYMMGDVQHLVLLRADFSNKDKLKGNLVFKC